MSTSLATVRKSVHGALTFPFEVKGQRGCIPRVGLGTVTLFGEDCVRAVRTAIRAGYRLIDTALLYDNQEVLIERKEKNFFTPCIPPFCLQ